MTMLADSFRGDGTRERLLSWGAVAVAMAVAISIVGLVRDDPVTSIWIVTAFFAVLVVWVVAQDATTYTIDDCASLSLAIVAIAYRVGLSINWRETFVAMAIDVLLTGGILLVFREIYYRRRGFDGLGMGDVKLAAAGGLLVGVVQFSLALFAASLLALGFAGLIRLLSNDPPSPESKRAVAFGAFLAPTLWAVWVAGQMSILPDFSVG